MKFSITCKSIGRFGILRTDSPGTAKVNVRKLASRKIFASWTEQQNFYSRTETTRITVFRTVV